MLKALELIISIVLDELEELKRIANNKLDKLVELKLRSCILQLYCILLGLLVELKVTELTLYLASPLALTLIMSK